MIVHVCCLVMMPYGFSLVIQLIRFLLNDGGWNSVARHSNRTYLECRNECSIHPMASDFDKDKSKDISPPWKPREQERVQK